jgi:hypothetical protein
MEADEQTPCDVRRATGARCSRHQDGQQPRVHTCMALSAAAGTRRITIHLHGTGDRSNPTGHADRLGELKVRHRTGVSHGSNATMPGGSEAAQTAISGRTRTRRAAIWGWPSSACWGPSWRRFHCCQRWSRWSRTPSSWSLVQRLGTTHSLMPSCGRSLAAVLLEAGRDGAEVRARHPDCGLPRGPDPALQAPAAAIGRAGSNQSPRSFRTSRPVEATRSPSRMTSLPASMGPGNHAGPRRLSRGPSRPVVRSRRGWEAGRCRTPRRSP